MIDYRNTSAADDYETVDADAWDEDEGDWLDDFEFDGDDDGDMVDGLWGSYGGRRTADDAARMLSALKLCQGLVDTFATGHKPYRVSFDESITTAGTDYKARQVVISHRPLFDPTITPEIGQKVVTAMAVHEADHVRYGRRTHDAVEKAYAYSADRGPALAMSNLLDDVRIERRHVEDYPGMTGLFAPAIDYVATSELRRAGMAVYLPGRLAPKDRATAAVRYAAFADWAGHEVEREWWTDWAERGTRTDKVPEHLDAVAEAVEHLREMAEADKESAKQDAEKSSSRESASSGADGDGSRESSDDPTSTDDAGSPEPTYDPVSLPQCAADAIDREAMRNGETSGMTEGQAQTLAEQSKAVVSTDHGTGEVYWAPGGIAKRRERITVDGSVSGAIRAAFARTRTGHYDVERNLKSGRLDNRSLTRCAMTDYRLFNRKSAPSEGKYLVWVMVDCSGSMGFSGAYDAAQVATSLATASRFLPNIRLDIFGWTSGWRFGGFGVVRVWGTGDPIGNVGYLPNVPQGGTPDAGTLAWAAKAIKDAARPGETPIIVIASDGYGDLVGDPDGIIAKTRKSGVGVVGVAIGRLDNDVMTKTYGDRGWVGWTGSIKTMARPLGELIARVATGKVK